MPRQKILRIVRPNIDLFEVCVDGQLSDYLPIPEGHKAFSYLLSEGVDLYVVRRVRKVDQQEYKAALASELEYNETNGRPVRPAILKKRLKMEFLANARIDTKTAQVFQRSKYVDIHGLYAEALSLVDASTLTQPTHSTLKVAALNALWEKQNKPCYSVTVEHNDWKRVFKGADNKAQVEESIEAEGRIVKFDGVATYSLFKNMLMVSGAELDEDQFDAIYSEAITALGG